MEYQEIHLVVQKRGSKSNKGMRRERITSHAIYIPGRICWRFSGYFASCNAYKEKRSNLTRKSLTCRWHFSFFYFILTILLSLTWVKNPYLVGLFSCADASNNFQSRRQMLCFFVRHWDAAEKNAVLLLGSRSFISRCIFIWYGSLLLWCLCSLLVLWRRNRHGDYVCGNVMTAGRPWK